MSPMVSLVLVTLEMASQIISDRGVLACFNDEKIPLSARLLFAIGSALTAAAPSMNTFIVGKAIAGIGSSGSYISIINISPPYNPPRERLLLWVYRLRVGTWYHVSSLTLLHDIFLLNRC